nr:TetR family transcriptional regulator [Cellulosimicrobium sp. MM]
MAYLPRAERRDSIVAAAAAVVRRDGLGAVTARVVADELGGSPGQIHHHFASTGRARRRGVAAVRRRRDRRLRGGCPRPLRPCRARALLRGPARARR